MDGWSQLSIINTTLLYVRISQLVCNKYTNRMYSLHRSPVCTIEGVYILDKYGAVHYKMIELNMVVKCDNFEDLNGLLGSFDNTPASDRR